MRDNLTRPEPVGDWEFRLLKGVALYQFSSREVSECLFPDKNDFLVQRSLTTGKIRNVLLKESAELYLVLRAQDFLFSITTLSALRLKECTKPPKLRVVIPSSLSSFVREGKNVFAKFVVDADPELRPNDEVLVVDEGDNLLAVGKMKLSGEEVKHYKRGVAVQVKRGVEELG